MMNKEFVPYEQALALKELGFNPTIYFGWYSISKSFSYHNGGMEKPFYEEDVKTPLYQQAFRWFREKYKLYFSSHYSNLNYIGKWQWLITYEDNAKASDFVNTYEEAELECLTKLIEIVKNDNTNN